MDSADDAQALCVQLELSREATGQGADASEVFLALVFFFVVGRAEGPQSCRLSRPMKRRGQRPSCARWGSWRNQTCRSPCPK